MYVIGTAGHVDHGKSALVKALTGTDPDRLREEKQRQMTIELGFAFFNTTNGEEVGIIDVPGHRDFIENMLAGVGGINAVLLVIAADEGVMPQTREHLAIIDLLKISTGIVVLTKSDLIDEPDWFEMVEADIRKLLKGTVLEDRPIVRVSSLTGAGIDRLRSEIDRMLTHIPSSPDSGRPRLPVDRVFSIQGFGTVVTGTLSGGTLRVEDTVEILPSKTIARIRGLQTHNRKETIVLPGSRTAINLSGVTRNEIKRGDVITIPGLFKPTRRIDAQVEVLPDASTVIRHNDLVKIYLAASESVGRIRLLEKERIDAGCSGWVQVEFETEVVAEKGDRFIFRRMSPAETLGGGVVVNPDPVRRYKLNDPAIISYLEARLQPSGNDILFNFIEDTGFVSMTELRRAKGISGDAIDSDLHDLEIQKKVISLTDKSDVWFLTSENWNRMTQKLVNILSEWHARFPLRPGITIDEMKRRTGIKDEIIQSCVFRWISDGTIRQVAQYLALPDFSIKYSPSQSKKLEAFETLIREKPFNPPSVSEIQEMLGSDLFQSLIDQGKLVQITADVAFRDVEYHQMIEYVLSTCKEGNSLTVATFRDHFASSRKYSLAFLEHLDQKGITERIGEVRRLKVVKSDIP